jgi:DNA-binding NarL/FixJ family response regulator
MNKELHIALVDDHELFREGLKFLLDQQMQNYKVKEASNGFELLQLLNNWTADVVLMDIEMPVMNGIEATKKINEFYPNTKIIALSMHDNEGYYSDMINAGAKAFLLKNSKFEEVLQAIEAVYNNNSFFSAEILESLIKNLSQRNIYKSELTHREVEVLYNICKGYSNQETADLLHISKRTVDKHRENILLKTQSKNTASLVIYAIKHNIFEV